MCSDKSSNQNVNEFDPKCIKDSEHVTVSATALTHLRKEIVKRGGGIGVRLSLKKSGCTGYRYMLDIIDSTLADDVVFVIAGDFKLFVAADCFAKVRGSNIDYVTDDNGLNKYIKITNPNETSRCGCGESFSTGE